ncbi:MAG: four helix bundle protein [Patescibacteria group bacterium]
MNYESGSYPPKLSGIAAKLLAVYSEWQQYMHSITKTLRYSLAIHIDQIFVEIVSLTAEAQFSSREIRVNPINQAIIKNDTLKFMLYTIFELKGIDNKKFLSLSVKTEEIGRMLYGWKNQCPKIEPRPDKKINETPPRTKVATAGKNEKE